MTDKNITQLTEIPANVKEITISFDGRSTNSLGLIVRIYRWFFPKWKIKVGKSEGFSTDGYIGRIKE